MSILEKNLQGAVVFHYANLCFTFVKAEDGSLCLPTGTSAVEIIESVLRQVSREKEFLDYELDGTKGRQKLMAAFKEADIPSLNDLHERYAKTADEKLVKLEKYLAENANASVELKNLLELAKKYKGDPEANFELEARDLNAAAPSTDTHEEEGCGICPACIEENNGADPNKFVNLTDEEHARLLAALKKQYGEHVRILSPDQMDAVMSGLTDTFEPKEKVVLH
jgi:hypothetical protein